MRFAWLVGVVLCASVGSAHAEPATKVYLDGVPAPVFFNDGDSFRVLSGKYAGTKARLAGYNTLESYGPAHQWGDWDIKELYVIAKMATYHARNGVWHCTTEGDTDTYGRMLWFCDTLAEELIRLGYAHALTVTEDPAKPAFVAAQKEAIAARRGMWAHGVPEFVLTSLHSALEDPTRDYHYNRLVSSVDGHSEKWKHNDTYAECSTICDAGWEAPERRAAAVTWLREQDASKAATEAYNDDELFAAIEATVKGTDGLASLLKAPEHEALFAKVLADLPVMAADRVGDVRSCMLYVDFRRRFGGGKAACLK